MTFGCQVWDSPSKWAETPCCKCNSYFNVRRLNIHKFPYKDQEFYPSLSTIITYSRPCLPLLHPPPCGPNLPQVRLTDKIRLSTYVLNTITIPVVPSTRNKVARMQIGADAESLVVMRMIRQINPDIRTAIDEREPGRLDFITAVFVDLVDIRAGRDAVVLSWRKRLVAP